MSQASAPELGHSKKVQTASPTTWFKKTLSGFADNAVTGIWSIVLASLVASFSNWWNQDEIKKASNKVEEATKALKAKSDYDTAFNLMERLSSNAKSTREEERKAYREMLGFLERSESRFDSGLATIIKNYMESFDKQNMRARPSQALGTEVVDSKKIDDIKAVITSSISNTDLPVRLYVQIANIAQRKKYEKIAQTFKDTSGRVRVPDAEVVGNKAPALTDIRYCPSTKLDVAQAVRQQVEAVIGLVVLRQLPETLCRTVPQNNIELWLSKDVS